MESLISLFAWMALGGMGVIVLSKSIRRWTGESGELVEETHESWLPEIREIGKWLVMGGLGIGGIGAAVVIVGGFGKTGPGNTNTSGPSDIVAFSCDWPTTGSTQAARFDCGAVDWAAQWGSTFAPDVVTAASSPCVGWRTTNVLRFDAPADAGQVYFNPSDNLIDTVDAPGGTGPTIRSWSVDICWTDFPPTDPYTLHGFQDADGADPPSWSGSDGSVISWGQEVYTNGSGWRPLIFNVNAFTTWNGVHPSWFKYYEWSAASAPDLGLDTVFTVQQRVQALTDSTTYLDARVYVTSTGVLRLQATDFINSPYNDVLMSADSVLGLGNTPRWLASAGYALGVNGWDDSASRPGVLEVARFRICDGDWCAAP